MNVISFRLDVEPRGQGRPRIGVIAGHAMAFKDSKSREHETTLRAMCSQFRPKDSSGNVVQLQGPIQVVIVATLPRPAALCHLSKRAGNAPLVDARARWSTSKPDVDNIAKGVLDAMRDWWADDRQVAVLLAVKRIAALDESPHYSVVASEVCPAQLWLDPICLQHEANVIFPELLSLAIPA